MATVIRAESNHMYSWWWASHISPKNSKWLQENLTDMDSNVKQMIKIIEVDEDSFARRAEMYYKKCPELMKLVEEFYRAYRALAERYDHATRVIRHAHKTMAEAFPNQVPFLESDNASCELAELTPSDFHSAERNRPFFSREAPFAKLAEGKVRKALNFHEKAQGLSQSERLERSETDIKALKEALAKLEAEKEEGLFHYQESMQRLSSLESEVLRAQQDSRGFHEGASKAESEVQSLKESLAKLEGEREASLSQYQQCLDRISSLESCVSCSQEDAVSFEKRASEAEKEVKVLKTEKEAGLAKYLEALEKIANLENKLMLAEDKVSLSSERADNAEKEVATLKEALAKITEEKEAAALQYQECLVKMACLENEIAKLKDAEEQCLLLESSNRSMKSEMDTVLFRLGTQNEELLENQKELGRLRKCIQEERVRFVEAETAFRTLQSLHSQTQEELRSMSVELQKRVQLLKDMEVHNQNLEGEVQKIRDENKSLNEISINSAVSLKNMQDEIINLKEEKEKLEEELELQLDQRHALQQEIYCLKDLQEENSKLKETCQSSEAEISVLLEKLGVMEKLIEKNATLEHSLSVLSAELEDARGKVKALEESCQLLMDEKSIVLAEKATLISQLAITTENLEKLSKRNTFLVNTLFDVNAELEALRAKSGNLEYSCRLLNDEKSILVSERRALELKLETTHQRLDELGKKHADLEKSYHGMEEERVSTLKLVEDLHNSLAAEKQDHDKSTQLSQMQMAEMESKICVLQELVEQTKGQLGEELDKAANAQFEIFILRNTLQDLRETNCSWLKNCEKLLEMSNLSEKLISKLEHENTEKKEEVRSLSDHIMRLRMGMFQLLKVLEVDLDHVSEDNLDGDQMVLHQILFKLDDTRESLFGAWDENQKLVIEKTVLVTLLGQLKQEVADLKTLIDGLQQEFSKRNDQLLSLQGDMLKLLHSNETLLLRVRERNHKEELLASEMENLRAKLQEMQGVCQDLEKENCRILEENMSLKASLEKCDDDLKDFKTTHSELEHEIANAKDMLSQKEAKICRMQEEHKETNRIVKILHSDLKMEKDEAELWETVSGTTFVELQTSSVREALYRDKLSELTEEYQFLVDQNYFVGLEVVQLKERVGSLECENSEIEAQWAEYVPAMATIKDAVASLERHVMHTEVGNGDEKDVVTTATSNGFSDLHELAVRIKAVDNKVKETKRLPEERSLRTLKSPSRRSQPGISRSRSRRFPLEAMEKITKQLNQINSEPEEAVVELAMKDIMLDQASKTSSRRINRKVTPYNNTESDDDQILELWKDAPTPPGSYYHNNSPEVPVEKELRVDSLELSKRYIEPNEAESNKKILERLSSGVQKLTNLQITVQDLKQKVKITENSKPAKAKVDAEYTGVNSKLEETERTILKLLEVNSKLVKNIQDCSTESPLWPTSSSSFGDPSEIGESEQRRRKVTEQAKRCSEKIGRLQVETQKIQFLLLKLDGSSRTARSSGAQIIERDRKVLLQDYLYGHGGPAPRRRSKARFCACVQPPTSGD